MGLVVAPGLAPPGVVLARVVRSVAVAPVVTPGIGPFGPVALRDIGALGIAFTPRGPLSPFGPGLLRALLPSLVLPARTVAAWLVALARGAGIPVGPVSSVGSVSSVGPVGPVAPVTFVAAGPALAVEVAARLARAACLALLAGLAVARGVAAFLPGIGPLVGTTVVPLARPVGPALLARVLPGFLSRARACLGCVLLPVPLLTPIAPIVPVGPVGPIRPIRPIVLVARVGPLAVPGVSALAFGLAVFPALGGGVRPPFLASFLRTIGALPPGVAEGALCASLRPLLPVAAFAARLPGRWRIVRTGVAGAGLGRGRLAVRGVLRPATVGPFATRGVAVFAPLSALPVAACAAARPAGAPVARIGPAASIRPVTEIVGNAAPAAAELPVLPVCVTGQSCGLPGEPGVEPAIAGMPPPRTESGHAAPLGGPAPVRLVGEHLAVGLAVVRAVNAVAVGLGRVVPV